MNLHEHLNGYVKVEAEINRLLDDGFITPKSHDEILRSFHSLLDEASRKPNDIDCFKVTANMRPLFVSERLIGPDDEHIIEIIDDMLEVIFNVQRTVWNKYFSTLKPHDFKLSKKMFDAIRAYGWERCWEAENGPVIACFKRKSAEHDEVINFYWSYHCNVNCRSGSNYSKPLDDEEFKTIVLCAEELQNICRGVNPAHSA